MAVDRRTILRTAALSTVGFAGCLGRSPGDSGTTPGEETTTQDGDATMPNVGEFRFEPSADAPFQTLAVGSRDSVDDPDNNRPNRLRLWNDANEARKLALVVTTADEKAVEEVVEFPADGYLALDLLEPGEYAVSIGLDGLERGRVEVPREWFDCNQSQTDVRVSPTGRVQSYTARTEIACPPRVLETTFETLEGECGDENQASVSFDGSTILVEGRVVAPTPCHRAALRAATVDGRTDTLRVTIGTTDPAEGGCIQCIGEVGYEVTLRMDGRSPGTVEVVHESRGGTTTVTTARL